MTIQDLAAVIGAVVTGLAGLFAMLRFLVKHYLNELRPNSGSSMKLYKFSIANLGFDTKES
jgi:hypothetical protein